MSKNNVTTGMRLQNRQIYEEALRSGHWICYRNKWYTPSEFATQAAQWEINIAHVTIENPRAVLKRGREAYAQRIRNGESKDKLLDGLKRLNAFFHKFWLHCHPDSFDFGKSDF